MLHCLDKGCAIGELSIEELQKISPVFEADVYDAISLKTCVEKRLTTGGPGRQAMLDTIEMQKAYLNTL